MRTPSAASPGGPPRDATTKSASGTPSVVDEAEAYVRDLADELTRPRANECLCCFVARQIVAFSCDGTHRHVERYRDAAAPRATGLIPRLRRMGACCCDGELFLNVYRLRRDLCSPLDSPCAGVRRGSTQPCQKWVRLRP